MAQEPTLKEQLETLAQAALVSAVICAEISSKCNASEKITKVGYLFSDAVFCIFDIIAELENKGGGA